MASNVKRVQVGSVLKGKEGASSYIKIGNDVSLKRGDILRLESKKSQLASLEAAVANSKMSQDMANKIKERVEKIPDFVLFEIIQLQPK